MVSVFAFCGDDVGYFDGALTGAGVNCRENPVVALQDTEGATDWLSSKNKRHLVPRGSTAPANEQPVSVCVC